MCVVRMNLAATAVLLAVAPFAAYAQDTPGDTVVYVVDPIVVTATRGPRALSNSPAPISVIQRRDFVEQVPNTISDVFRSLPGLDVTGVGVNQVRPQIRGQGGQRILLLNDGLRMNNTRRQRDFGELPALVDLGAVQQVEVVRGPASVLYGSDAIGGVVNIITEAPIRDGSRAWASYLFGSAAGQNKASMRFEGRGGAFSFQGGGTWRSAGSYEAPSGEFGDISLASDVEVHNSGVDDRTFDTRFGWDLSESLGVFAKVEQYQADDAGFGYVDPDDYSPGDAEIQILYPQQRFTKLSGGLRGRGLGAGIVDDLDVTLYGQDNERQLVFDAYIPAFPGASVALDNRNFTDIRTYGLRAEARKRLSQQLQLTYGVDGFQDDSEGTDNNTQTLTGFGPPPPIVTRSNAPSIPNAKLRSLGAFLQGEVDVTSRLSVVAGARYQDVSADTRATPNLNNTPLSASHSAAVGTLNAMLEVVEGVHLIGTVGRGFRSPNLVELFFDGAVPEASAYQSASPTLEAEKSLNFDVGARYQNGPLFLEGFYFHNEISDGIRSDPVLDTAGDTVQTQGLDTYENVNVEKIRVEGFEASADVRLASGLMLGASFATQSAEDAIDPQNPVGESYSTRVTGRFGYRDPSGRYWGEWETRYNGKELLDVFATDESVPFTVHHLRGGMRLIQTGGLTHGLTLTLSNLTNELYAETANASFFRPEPKRNLTLSWDVSF